MAARSKTCLSETGAPEESHLKMTAASEEAQSVAVCGLVQRRAPRTTVGRKASASSTSDSLRAAASPSSLARCVQQMLGWSIARCVDGGVERRENVERDRESVRSEGGKECLFCAQVELSERGIGRRRCGLGAIGPCVRIRRTPDGRARFGLSPPCRVARLVLAQPECEVPM